MLVASLASFDEVEKVGDLADLIELRLDRFIPPGKPLQALYLHFPEEEPGRRV